MDERFKGKRMWLGFGALAVIFLCVMLCAFGAIATMFTRHTPLYGQVPYVQAPAGEEGAAPPATYHGPVGVRGHDNFGPLGLIGAGLGLIAKLLFFGLLLALLFGLVRHLFWGRRWRYGHWGPPCPPGVPPTGDQGADAPPAGWGPPAWHHHGKHWGPPPWWRQEAGQAPEQDKPDAAEPDYTGPQE
jgi:hypothetical protein